MRLFSLFVVFLAVAAWTAPVAAQPAGDPVPKILEAWKKRQTAFKTVKYEVSGTVKHFFVSPPRAGLEKVMKLPKAPFEIPYKAVLLLDCDTKRYRLWTEQAVWSPLSGVFFCHRNRQMHTTASRCSRRSIARTNY